MSRRLPGGRILTGSSLWDRIATLIRQARRVHAAIAYVGTGGHRLLPLRRGDSLVVDMGIRTVGEGLTNPFEIQRFLKKGVRVFTRANLHAKFVIADRTLIIGSANASLNSRDNLDEAALETCDVRAVRQALFLQERLGTEPVGWPYLRKCIELYSHARRTLRRRGSASARKGDAVRPKLWFLGHIGDYDPPEEEAKKIASIERKARRRMRPLRGWKTLWIRWRTRPGYLDQLSLGTWVVCGEGASGRGLLISAPSVVLDQKPITTSKGKSHVLIIATPSGASRMTWKRFRSHCRAVWPTLNPRMRVQPCREVWQADAVLRLWPQLRSARSILR